MTPTNEGSESTALFGGHVLLLQPPVVEVLGLEGAIAIQQLHYQGLKVRAGGGWVELSGAGWARAAGGLWDRTTWNRAFNKLERLDVVESRSGRVSGRRARLPLYQQLAELVGQPLRPEAVAHAQRVDATLMQSASGGVMQSASPGPHGERRGVPVQSPLVAALEGEGEREGDLHPESSAVDVATPASQFQPVDGQGGGTGRAPRGSVEEALRVLGTCGHSSTRLQVLARDLGREPAPVDGGEWAEAYAPDFPRWAVIRALLHVRHASADERARVETRLMAISWRELNRDRREQSA